MKIYDYMFCDDIRQEANNKFSLMGLYNDRLVVRVKQGQEIKWPISIPLGILIRVENENSEVPKTFQFELLLNGKILASVTGDLAVKNESNIWVINLKLPLINLDKGILAFTLKVYDEKSGILLDHLQKKALEIIETPA